MRLHFLLMAPRWRWFAVPILLAAGSDFVVGQEPTPQHRVPLADEPPAPTGAERLVRRWFENIDVYGFGAFGYLDSGATGARPDGGFLVKEASLFVEAEVWDQTSFFCEIQVNRLGEDDTLFVRTGEVHVHFRNVLAEALGEGALGIKVGRIDIPFGEEYLWQDAVDNPLITATAAYPYGFDEGVLLYGKAAGIAWIAAVSDGNEERSREDGPGKAFNLKLQGEPWRGVAVSASAMHNGRAGESALEFGGSHLQPVGADGNSSAGASPSTKVDANLYELDVKFTAGELGSIGLAFGQAHVGDEAPGFDRDLSWGMLEVRGNLGAHYYVVGRASEIGTYSDREGYHFDGKILADGNAAFGYDVERLQRLSLGGGYAPNVMWTAKVEIGRDRFWSIDGSGAGANGEDRFYYGFELAVRF